MFNVSKGCAQSYKKKLRDPTFHPGNWGGFRGLKYGSHGMLIQRIVWLLMKSRLYNYFNISLLVGLLKRIPGLHTMTEDFIARIFQSWGWTWKKPVYTQIEVAIDT